MNPTHANSLLVYLRRSSVFIALVLVCMSFAPGISRWKAEASRGVNQAATTSPLRVRNAARLKNRFLLMRQNSMSTWGGWEARTDYYSTLLNGAWRTPAIPAPMAALFACTGTSPNIVCTSSNVTAIDLTPVGTPSNSTPSTASVYPSQNFVTATGTVTSVSVRLNGLSNAIPDNMDMLLVAPSGQKFQFWGDVGGFGPAMTNQTITVSDSASTDLPDTTPPTTGSYKPRNYFSFQDIFPASGAFSGFTVTTTTSAAPGFSPFLPSATFDSVFNGVNANGTWELYIAVDGGSSADTASLQSWDLILGVSAANAPTTVSMTSTVNPVLIPLSGNSTATITATVTSSGNPVTLGAVTFLEGSQTLAANVTLNASGQASFTFNTTGSTNPVLGEGTHIITANYSGATGFGSSNGNTLTQVVDRATQVTGNTFCNTGKLTMSTAANGPAAVYPSKIFVSGLSGTTQSVTLQLNGFSHPFTDDVNLLLVSPTGQKFVPFAYISNLSPTSNATIVLDDNAANALPSTGGVASGTYRPSHGLNGSTFNQATFPSTATATPPALPYNNAAPGGSATFTSTFAGDSPNGTWTLYVVNWGGTAGAGLRELAGGWCLTIGTSSDPATTTTVSVTPSPSALNQSVTVSALVTQTSNGSPVNAQGTVTFMEGNTVLAGPLNVNSIGIASFNTSTLTQGAHTITANYSGSPGSYALSSGNALHYVDAATTNPSSGQFCNTSPLTFPAVTNSSASPYPTRINVSGLPGTVAKVTLSLNGLSAAFIDDVDMMLTGPNGNSLIAFSDVGSNSTSVSNIDLVLDSTSANTLQDTGAPASGTFRPADFSNVGADVFASPAPTTNVFSAATTSFATAFNNSNPNGIWTLWTSLDGPGGGSLSGGWCLNFTINQPQLTISKTHVGNFTQGQTGAQYTVTVGSSGPGSTAGTITVVDTPPPGMTVTGMSGNGWTCTVGTRTCTTTATLAANGSLPPITVTVDIANNATTPLSNSAAVGGGGALGATVNDSTIINQVADLMITKTSGSSFAQGGTAVYSTTIFNTGAGATSGNYTISDTMPTGLTLVLPVTTPNGFDCSASTTTFLNCVKSTVIAAASSATGPSFTVNIASNAPASITNIANISGGGELITTNNNGSATYPVAAAPPDLTVTKSTQGSGPFFRGGQVTWLIQVNNTGPNPTSGPWSMTDNAPTGTSFVTVGAGSGISCIGNSATITCNSSVVIPAGGSQTITLLSNIASNAAASIINTASASGGGETNTTNNSGSFTINPADPADLTISKTAQGSSFQQGGTITYDIVVSNSGIGGTTSLITVQDVIPTGLTVTSASGTNWTCAGTATVTCTNSTGIPAGGASTITLVANIAANAPASITNTATVTGGGEIVTNNNSGFTTVNVTPLPPDLRITKLAQGGPFIQGGTVTYDITVINDGNGSTTGTITMQDIIPTGLTATSATGANWTCVLGATVQCSRTTALGAGANSVITLVANIASNASSSITNTATVATTGESNTGNNSGISVISVGPRPLPDLTLSKLPIGAGPFTQGGTMNFGITVSNLSQTLSTQTNTTVSDTMPTGLTVTSVTGSTWSCTINGGGASFICIRSQSIAPNTTTQVILATVQIAGNAPASITNTATLTGDDDTPGNNSSPATITVTQRPDLTISKVASGGPFVQGGTVTYTLTVSNNGSGPTTLPINVQDVIPTGLTVTSATGANWSCTTGATVACIREIPPLGAGATSSITLVANIAANAPSSISNTATVATTGESDTGNNSDTSVISVSAITAVTINVPAGVSYSFNGQSATGSQTFNVAPGTYVLSTTTPQSLGSGIRAAFNSWSDAGAITHNVTVGSTALTITGNFTTQYQLTTAASPANGGTVTPATGQFFDSGTVVNVSATANSGFAFGSWTGPVASASSAATTVTMDAAKSVTANFTALTDVTVTTNPSGLTILVDGNTYTAPQTFQFAPGSNHTLATTTPQSLGSGAQAVFSNWSDSGAIAHTFTTPASATTFTANFTTQYQLTMAASPANGGTVTPASGTFYNSGTVVNVNATANSGFVFGSWTGPVASSNSASTTVTMDAAKSVTANFITCPTSFTVNDLGDTPDATPGDKSCNDGTGKCTLRAAIQEANAITACSPLTINFSVTGTIDLATALPVLNHPNLTVNGPGASQLTVRRSTIAGTPEFRIFEVNGSLVRLAGLTITNGKVPSGNFGGGVVAGAGSLTLESCVITGNSSGYYGGGIACFGTLTVNDCLISGNQADNAGGLMMFGGNLTMSNTTISGNITAFQDGGMLFFGGANGMLTNCTISGNMAGTFPGGLRILSGNTVTLTNCTVTDNQSDGGIGGIQIVGSTSALRLQNTIVANNVGPNFGNNSGTVTSLGNNLTSDNGAGLLTGTGDLINTNPLLAVLGSYGGTTQTHALLPGSPAINAGTASGAPTADQRGQSRFGATDIGAFESQGFALTIAGGSGQSTPVGMGFANPLAVTVTANYASEPVNGGRVSFTPPASGASAALATSPATIAGGQASVTATANNVTGSYSVTANTTPSLPMPVSFNLTNSCPTITATVGGGGAICATQSANVTVTVSGGIAPYTVTLNNGGGTQTGSGPVFTFNVSPANTTTYGVQSATDANGCAVTATGSATVTVNQLPVASAGPAQTICQTQTTAVLGGNAPPSGTVGAWTSNSGGSFAPNATTPNATWTPPANFSGVATLTWTVTSLAGCGTTQMATVQVTVNGNPVAAVGGAQTIGVNQTSAPLGTGPLPYATTGQWTSNSGGTFSNVNDPAATWTPPANFNGIALLTWTVSSTAGCGVQQTGTVQVTVSCAAITFSPTSLAAAAAGTAYSQQLTVTPSGSYTFSIILGSLPSGLTLNPTTGLISGLTSGTGTFNFTVKALSSNGCSATQAYTLVLNCPTITLPGSITTPTINTAYSQTVAASPAGSYSYAVTAGALPAGLTLNAATGVISGTPTTGGAYSFTIRATRFGTCTGSQTYSGTISCPTITLACPSCSSPGVLPDGRVNTLYVRSLAATPSATYTYSISAGALPPGLSLIGGSLSGRPTTAGTYNFTVRAQGSGGCFGTQAYTLTVTPATLASKPNQTDFDGDGKSDLWSYRATDGRWLIQRSRDNTIAFVRLGSVNEVAVPADYDGDGQTDAAVFNAAKSRWQIINSSDGSLREERFGASDAQAFAADFDGDGKADLAVKSTNGEWQIKPSSDGEIIQFVLGETSDQPVIGDFNGDGLADIGNYRAGGSHWLVRDSQTGAINEQPVMSETLPNAQAIAADFDGDGADDFAVWSQAMQQLQFISSRDQHLQTIKLPFITQLVTGDYDGDGRADLMIGQMTANNGTLSWKMLSGAAGWISKAE